jgi:hypothetical protein
MSVIIDGTNGISPANWTTAGRPSSPVAGQQGYNTTLNSFEIYSGVAWITITSQTY